MSDAGVRKEPAAPARAVGTGSPPVPAPPQYSLQERYLRKEESLECESIAQREGDRLLKLNDLAGAEVAHRIAGRIRIRRDEHLEPF